MALQPSTLDVPLSVLDQSSPTTSGPLGRLTSLVDAEVIKFNTAKVANVPTAVRVDKRSGFSCLSDRVRTVSDGAISLLAEINNQTLLTEFSDRLLLVANDNALVYSGTTTAWESHSYQLSTDTITQRYIHTSNTLASTPDIAYAQGVSCYVWVNEAAFDPGGGAPSELAGCYFTVVDSEGVTLRASTRLDPFSTRVKVVSDGAYFWILSETGNGTGTFKVRLIDRYGLDLASTTFAVTYTTLPGYWDTVAASFGVTVAQVNTSGAGVQLTKLTYDPETTVITVTSNTDVTISGFQGLAFLTNDVDGYAYLATVEHVGTDSNTIHAYRITSGLAQDHDYTVASTQVDEIGNVTGYVVPDSTSNLVVAFSVLDNTVSPGPVTLSNVIREFNVPFSGSPTLIKTMRSMNLASRAFAIRDHYYYLGYYPSQTVVVAYNTELPNQPTYFLCPMNNINQNVTGRFEYGIAYADWQGPGSNYNYSLASCIGTSEGMRAALSYRAESFTSQRIQVNGDVTARVMTQVNTVGVKSFSFDAQAVRSVSYNTDILLPGAQATTWSGGAFSESNVALGFEPPLLTVNTIGSAGMTQGTYQYVVVAEWTDHNGNRVRSVPSAPVTCSITTGFQTVTVSGRMMHATNKKDVLIAIYRTDMNPDSGGGYVTTTEHYKITVDAPTVNADPLYNDDAQSSWQFEDANTTITANEILYTDKGQLANYPAPPFSKGTVWRNRVWLIGYDNALWFSAEPTEGDAIWFHPAFRVTLPTTDQITSVVTMDDALLIFCLGSIWYLSTSGPLPDSSGTNGNIPTPIPLPFKQGSNGQAVVAREGCYYSSTSNGLWLITRQLTNLWVGEQASDILNGPISKMTIDAKQRVYCVVGNSLVVFDTISQCFYEWSTPANIEHLTTWNGSIAFGDNDRVWRQLDGTYTDILLIDGVQTIIPYYQSMTINFMHLGGVRNYKRLWAVQFAGETHTASTATVQARYDDDSEIKQTLVFSTDPNEPFAYELKPKKQLCSSIGFTITEGITSTQEPGQGYSLELLSFSLGLEPKGLNRLPISKRI